MAVWKGSIQQHGNHLHLFLYLQCSIILEAQPCNVAFWESFFNDQSETAEKTCHSWKISSSLSLSFFVSLVIVRGTGPCAACCCCIVEDEMTLCDLVSGRQSDVLLVQAASRAATLWRIHREEDAVSLKTVISTMGLHSSWSAFSHILMYSHRKAVWVLLKHQTGLLWMIFICKEYILTINFVSQHLVPKQEVVH